MSTMTHHYSGRCTCGAVTLEIAGPAVTTRQCWCRQCQRIATGGPTHNAVFPTEHVAIRGALAANRYVAASGNELTQWFCPACGTHIYGQSSARLHLRTVRMGVLDEPHDLAPAVAIWLYDAPPWAIIDPALEQHRQQPPPPPGPQS
jgi:hypothetical protein